MRSADTKSAKTHAHKSNRSHCAVLAANTRAEIVESLIICGPIRLACKHKSHSSDTDRQTDRQTPTHAHTHTRARAHTHTHTHTHTHARTHAHITSSTSIQVSHRQAKVAPHSAVTHDVLWADVQHFGHICFCGFGCRGSERQHTAALHSLFKHMPQAKIGRPAVLPPGKSTWCVTKKHEQTGRSWGSFRSAGPSGGLELRDRLSKFHAHMTSLP